MRTPMPRSSAGAVRSLRWKYRPAAGEEQELDSYLHIGRLLAVMQSRARSLRGNVGPQ